MGSLKSSWSRIEKWHKMNVTEVPEDEFMLSPGTTAEALDEAESELGLKLPKDVRDSYRIHNGSGHHAIFEYGFHLLSLDEAVSTWKMWRGHVEQGLFDNSHPSPKGPIKKTWWNVKWLPITHNSGGDHQCIDMDPDKRGHVGQVIRFSHEVGPVEVLAPSFEHWLLRFAEGLEAGKYRFDEEDLWIVPVES